MSRSPTTLILGWGNPGRRDDGLGPAFVEAVSRLGLPDLAVDADYQLTVEDAELAARHRRVVFVDADRGGPAPFRMRRLRPGPRGASFSTHSVGPEAVLALCRDLFDADPEAWLIGIRGYEFDGFGEGLSAEAATNLGRAVSFLRASLESGALRPSVPSDDLPPREAEDEVDRCPTPST